MDYNTDRDRDQERNEAGYQYPHSQVVLREVGQRSDNKMGTSSLVLGIITLVFCWIPILSMITGITGLIVSIIGIAKEERKGMPIAGLILSLLGMILAIFIVLLAIIGMAYEQY